MGPDPHALARGLAALALHRAASTSRNRGWFCWWRCSGVALCWRCLERSLAVALAGSAACAPSARLEGGTPSVQRGPRTAGAGFAGGVVRGWRFAGACLERLLAVALAGSAACAPSARLEGGTPSVQRGPRTAGAGLVGGVVRGWRFAGLSGTPACGGVGRLRCVRAFGTLGGRDALRPERPPARQGLLWCLPAGVVRAGFAMLAIGVA